MFTFTYWTDKISVCLQWQSKHEPDAPVPRVLHHDGLLAEQVPDLAPSEVGIVDGINLEFCSGVSKMIFLDQIIVSVDEFCTFHSNILSHAFNLALKEDTQMLSIFYPGEWVTTQFQGSYLSLSF